MSADKVTPPHAWQNVFEATFARFMGTGRGGRLSRREGLPRMPLLRRFRGRRRIRTPDPVVLAVLAIDRVGPAAVRACASGVEVRMAAPDEATAKVLRAALAETARRRDTDRLIRIVVD